MVNEATPGALRGEALDPQRQRDLRRAGLGIFGGFTIFDFNRLRRANPEGAVVIAASIFLDVFGVFLLLLQLFGGGRD